MKLSLIPILLLVTVSLFSAQSVSGLTFSSEINITTPIDPSSVTYDDVVVDGDNIYISYLNFGTASDRVFISSNDGGATWNTPLIYDSVFDNNDKTEIFVNDDGHVGLVWWLNDSPTQNSLNYKLSTDNGVTFGSTTSVPLLDGANELTLFDSQADSDGDLIAISFSDNTNAEFQAVVVSDDFGATWNEHIIQGSTGGVFSTIYNSQEQASISVHGMNIYVSWYASDGGDPEIYFTKSNDNGATFDTPTNISTPVVDIDNFNNQLHLNEDGGKVIVTFINADTNIYHAVSNDGGNTWNAPILVSDGATPDCLDLFWFDVLDESVVLVCQEGNNGEPAYIQSQDFGTTYSSLAVINSTLSGSLYVIEPYIASSGDNFMWLGHDDNLGETWLAYSQDNGVNWNVEFVPTLDDDGIDTWVFGSTSSVHLAVEDLWYFFGIDAIGDLFFVDTTIPNTGLSEPDTTAPVISPIGTEPIQVLENTIFDFTDHVVCLDDIDGDISIGMSIIGDTLDTTQRGTQQVTFSCTDVATNNSQETISFIVKKQSGSGGGGSSSSTSTSTVSSGTQSPTPSLSDIPTLSFQDRDPKMVETSEGGTSISDLFANLFSNRIDTQTGERPSEPLPEQATKPQLPKSFSPSSPTTSERPSPVTDFLNNLFASIFG